MNHKSQYILSAKFLISILVLVFSCSNNKTKSDSIERKIDSTNDENLGISEVQYKYKFDEIDYYKLEESIDYVMPYDEQVTDDNQYILKLMSDEIPYEITDQKFIPTLEKIGFKEYAIRESKHIEKLNKCFVIKRKPPPSSVPSCGAVYRDILILKNEGEIQGIAKLCYSCGSNVLLGGKQLAPNQIDVAYLSQINEIIKESI